MRLLHISSEYPPLQIFGLGRYVSDLSRHLAKLGHDVHVLTNSHGGLDQDVLEENVWVHRVDFPPPPKPPSPGGPVMAFNLHLAQRAHVLGKKALGDPEVIVSHDWLTALAGHRIARRWGIPHAWTVHDTVYGKRAGVIQDLEDSLAFRIETWATKVADLVLVNSRAIRDEIMGPYRGYRSPAVLHPGIDPDAYASAPPPERLAAFRSVFAQPDEILVTFAGRLDLEKGIDTLINAFRIVTERLPHAQLAIVGRGRLQPMIEEHIRKLNLGGHVRLYGYLGGTVLKYFYRAGDIHVCPSHYEPFGLVAAEAMASGTPVVASRTGGLVDLLSSSPVGRTVPPKDFEALAQAIAQLAEDKDLRRRMGEAGHAHVLQNFSWAHLSRKAAEFYASLAGGRRKIA